MSLEASISSLKAARKARGWSAAQLALRTAEIARANGDEVNLTQQAVSFFESGKAKSLPRWYRYAQIALFDDPDAVAARTHLVEAQTIMLPVALPPEFVLADMFRALMLSMPDVTAAMPADRKDELARELAKLLPSALARLKGPFRYEASAQYDRDDDSAPVPDSAHPERRRA